MTHALGPGTVNVTVNLPEDESRYLGRMACAKGMSRAAFVRWLVIVGLQEVSSTDATAIKAIRLKRAEVQHAARGVCLLILTLAAFAGQTAAMLQGSQEDDWRRTRGGNPKVRWTQRATRRGKEEWV